MNKKKPLASHILSLGKHVHGMYSRPSFKFNLSASHPPNPRKKNVFYQLLYAFTLEIFRDRLSQNQPSVVMVLPAGLTFEFRFIWRLFAACAAKLLNKSLFSLPTWAEQIRQRPGRWCRKEIQFAKFWMGSTLSCKCSWRDDCWTRARVNNVGMPENGYTWTVLHNMIKTRKWTSICKK